MKTLSVFPYNQITADDQKGGLSSEVEVRVVNEKTPSGKIRRGRSPGVAAPLPYSMDFLFRKSPELRRVALRPILSGGLLFSITL
jgi:hypothetical protein